MCVHLSGSTVHVLCVAMGHILFFRKFPMLIFGIAVCFRREGGLARHTKLTVFSP